MEWLLNNKEWIFSGAGIFALSVVIALFVKKRSTVQQSQKSGDSSTNYQSAGDINIGMKDDRE